MSKNQKRVLFISWITYATFYFLRVNFSIAIPGMIEEFGYSKVQLGGVASAFFFAYAFGQFASGQLADYFGPKKIVAIGLIFSVIISILVPVSAGYFILLGVLWGLNGLAQSMGWSPNVKIVSEWINDEHKGRASGILGTSYIVGGALSWLFAGYLAKFGWRYTFYGPAIVAVIVVIFWLYFAKVKETSTSNKTDFKAISLSVLKDRRVWMAALGLFGLNIVRYGFLTWIPTYFVEMGNSNITFSTFQALVFPLAGALGALSTGWLTDHYFKENRTLVGLIFAIALAISLIAFINVDSIGVRLGILAFIGFFTFGPHMLLVTQLPMIFGNSKNTASIVGFIDGVGYLGAALTGVFSGWLIDEVSWDLAFYFWLFGAVSSGVFIFLSNRNQKNKA